MEQSKVAESVPVLPSSTLFNGSNTPVGQDADTPREFNGYVPVETPRLSNGYVPVTKNTASTVTRSGRVGKLPHRLYH